MIDNAEYEKLNSMVVALDNNITQDEKDKEFLAKINIKIALSTQQLLFEAGRGIGASKLTELCIKLESGEYTLSTLLTAIMFYLEEDKTIKDKEVAAGLIIGNLCCKIIQARM